MRTRMMILLMVLLCVMICTAHALELGDPLTGEAFYPAGSDAATATYVYRYSYPQIAGDSDVAVMINEIYAYEAEYIETFTVPVNGDMYGVGETQFYTDMTVQVTCNNDDYLSVCFTTHEMTGGDPYTKMSANVFTLTGAKAGSIISLPCLLGILDIGETDEWLQDRQTAKADACVRQMIWELIQEQAEDGVIELYDDADYEYFEGCFYPEEDYYMEADGSLVFFLQEDTMAYAEYGPICFKLTIDDILDEL